MGSNSGGRRGLDRTGAAGAAVGLGGPQHGGHTWGDSARGPMSLAPVGSQFSLEAEDRRGLGCLGSFQTQKSSQQ